MGCLLRDLQEFLQADISCPTIVCVPGLEHDLAESSVKAQPRMAHKRDKIQAPLVFSQTLKFLMKKQ